jgi:dihydrofolate reductase
VWGLLTLGALKLPTPPVPQVIYRTATSLTGHIADERNSLAWLFAVDHKGVPDHNEFLAGIGVLVEGSTTYEWVLNEADLLAQPERWQDYYGDRPTFVFTTRELPVPQGADVRFVNGDVAQALPAISAAAGERDIWLAGGGELAGQFADIGALDRLELTIAPVALPTGAPLLPRRLESDRLSLISLEQYGAFAHLTYAVGPPRS